MLDTRHDLHSQFPQDGEILSKLKIESAHFRALGERYDLLDKEIRRIEVETEAASDERLEDLKKQRLGLLDEIAALIAAAR
ncbi:MAG TPA: DUF465 domain-containing protein [Sphingobium sp.]